MKVLTKILVVGISAFALIGLSSCCDNSVAPEAPAYEVPAK